MTRITTASTGRVLNRPFEPPIRSWVIDSRAVVYDIIEGRNGPDGTWCVEICSVVIMSGEDDPHETHFAPTCRHRRFADAACATAGIGREKASRSMRRRHRIAVASDAC
jgi:hypothetical protein